MQVLIIFTQNPYIISQNKWTNTANASSFSTDNANISSPNETTIDIVSTTIVTQTPRAIIVNMFITNKGNKQTIKTPENAYHEYSHSTDQDRTSDRIIGNM